VRDGCFRREENNGRQFGVSETKDDEGCEEEKERRECAQGNNSERTGSPRLGRRGFDWLTLSVAASQ
jgi:hypothetical protein